MKILLVNPPFATEGARHTPLGLAYIAAVLREHGYEVSVADFQIEPDTLHLVANADVVGITSISHSFPAAVTLAQQIKETNPDATVIMGGPHVTFTDTQMLQYPFVDIVVRHEGEYTMVEVLHALGTGDLSGVKGITYKKDGAIKRNPERPFIRDLDTLPFPARDLFRVERYYEEGSVPQVLSGRGCPYKCMFCAASTLWGHTVRLRSPDKVVDEIEHVLNQYTINRFGFYDDTFTIFPKNTVNICEEICKRGLDIQWACNVRVDTLTEDLVRTMKKAGCTRLFMGIESGNQKTLDFMHKRITLQHIRKAVKLGKKHSLEVVLSCILGFPNETYTDVQKTIDFMLSLNGDKYVFNFLLVFPGTELYERRKELKINYVDNPWERVGKTPFPIPTVETEYLSVYDVSQLYLEAKAKLEMLKRA